MKKQFAVLVLSFFATAFTFAQTESGSVVGTIVDSSGAAARGASVTLTNMSTGTARTVESREGGEYQILDLLPGNYSLKVIASGFGAYTAEVAVLVGGHTTVDVKLSVQAQISTIEVTGSDVGAEVNTSSSEVSQVITPLQLTQLPSLTRNPYDFVALSGNISSDPNGSTGRGVGVSFSGTRAASTEILLDGVENVDLFSQSLGVTVPLDSVQEYRVVTSGFSAEIGRASGGIVNVVTKSGTNSFHGSLYEYNRISALASNTSFENAQIAAGSPLPPDHFTQNQFGYSIGGPVTSRFKDKLFFFSNTEWNRIRSAGNTQYAVPTSAFLSTTAANTQAYFTQYGKLASGVTVGALVPGDPSFEQVTVTAPTNAGAGNPLNSWFTFDRIDYNATDKTNYFFRYDAYKDNIFPGTNSLSPYDGFNTGSTDYDQAMLASVNHVFTPNLILNTKYTYTRTNGGQPLGTAGVVPGLYLYAQNGASTAANGLPIALPGYLPTGPGNAIPFQGPQNFYQISGDLNYTKGIHSFLFGGAYIQVRDNRTFGAYLNATEFAGAPGDEAGGLAALQAGNLYQYNVAIDPGGKYPCPINSSPTPACELTLPVGPPSFTHENTFNDGNWYAQDTIKATPRLTLTFGLRWEYYGVQHDTKPYLDTNFYPATGGNLFENIRNGSVMPAPSSPVHGLYAKSLKNFAPRIGFAYDVFGDGKTSIRGGWGIAYERNFGNVTYNTLFNPPNYGVIDIISNQNGQGQIAVANGNYAPLSGAAGSTIALPPVELRALDPHLPTAYDYQMDLVVEHQVAPNMMASVEYTGTRGLHLYSIANINKIFSGNVYLGDPIAGDPLNLQYGSINVREGNADSYWNGVNFKFVDSNFQKNGLMLTANYTFSHALDDLSTTFSESNNSFNLGYTDPFNPALDHGNSDYDVRQRLVFSGIYEPTFLEFKSNSLMHTLFGGIEFAPIFTLRSGTPFTVYDCTYALYSCDRIVTVPGLQFHGKIENEGGGSYQYAVIPATSHNTYQDAVVGSADFPTFTANGGQIHPVGMDKDQFYDPHNLSLDLGVYKNFKIGERYNIQLRSEFYNFLNHSNFYANAFSSYYEGGTGPGGINVDEAVGGYKGTTNGYSPSSADERRNVQLALRFEF